MENIESIKQSLIKQLKDKGANVEHFLGLVDDYVWYAKQERKMQEDIDKRGSVYIATSAAGKAYEKQNPSIKDAIMFNKQKLAILKQLELTTENAESPDEDEL